MLLNGPQTPIFVFVHSQQHPLSGQHKNNAENHLFLRPVT